MKTSPFVFTQLAVLMQRILDCVCRGYPFWVSGTVPIEKVAGLSRKFQILYGVGESRQQRYRKKREKLGSAIVLWWWPGNGYEEVHWWLFVSEFGSHPARLTEKLADAHSPLGRVKIRSFELVRVPCSTGDARRYRWTWRFSNFGYSGWRESIRNLVRARSPRHVLMDRFQALFASPGFHGVRVQIGKLAAFYRAEWMRSRGREPLVPLPRRLGYVRRLPNSGIRLNQLAQEKQERN